jgi:hypothetical protein
MQETSGRDEEGCVARAASRLTVVVPLHRINAVATASEATSLGVVHLAVHAILRTSPYNNTSRDGSP